jgi:hypothetical protein
MQKRVLSGEERAYIVSFDTWTMTDQEQIKALAECIRQGRYRGLNFGVIGDTQADVICYQGSRRVASFRVHYGNIVTKNRHRFAYAPRVLSVCLWNLGPGEIEPLRARWECATNLCSLVFEGLWRGRRPHQYPDLNHWSDVIVDAYRRHHIILEDEDGRRERVFPDSSIARRFTCPGARANEGQPPPDGTYSASLAEDRWVSDYAMNPNCREDSADDTVFLFESQPGWNQHGGPELFTFENHDPRGGNVLLNDGTVKFVRTEKELQELRWK